jgi:hypothetical protein
MAIKKQILAIALSFSLVFASSVATALDALPAASAGLQDPQTSQQAPAATTNSAPSQKELEQLAAPIALYPDALIAQILAGATYPTQVVEADRWVKQNSSLKGEQLAAAIDKQPWDPSIKGLAQFPSVLSNMSTNLSWTSSLGDAYYNVPNDVMAAIQTLREEAKKAGHLESTPQQTVTTQGQTIIIDPANPEVVYVPTYSPATVYGAPMPAYPGYSGWDVAAASAISFGVGMAMGAAWGHGYGWGWGGWNTNWHGGNVTFNRNTYISNSNTFANRNTQYSQYRNTNVNNANVNRANVNNANVNRNTANQANRAATGQAGQRSGQLNQPDNRAKPQQAADRAGGAAQSRGFSSGDRPSTGTRDGSFSGFSQGGAARTDSSRGQSSFSSRPSGGGGGPAGGGGGGGGRAGGGGGGRR